MAEREDAPARGSARRARPDGRHWWLPFGPQIAKLVNVAKLTEKQMELISSAIAEPRRYKILKDLAAQPEPMACSNIVNKHDVSHATISHHLKELETAGLIEIERQGKFASVALRRDVWNAYVARLAELA
jgi:ArsR family transcriptional regulator, arsenate/arsenite/antimonite-responsive transcriptional repressor